MYRVSKKKYVLVWNALCFTASAIIIYPLIQRSAFGQDLSPMFMCEQREIEIKDLDMVQITHSGNPPARWTDQLGRVDYHFEMSTYEITNAQYAAFLNAVASDPEVAEELKVYSASMGNRSNGGIDRITLSDGSYCYLPKQDMGSKPVNFVRWLSAVRFVNWMNNQQPFEKDGISQQATESGAYDLQGGAENAYRRSVRDEWAHYALPNYDEFYKAAYYSPFAPNHYWLYAVQTNSNPDSTTASALGFAEAPGPMTVNYRSRAHWPGEFGLNSVLDIGSTGGKSFFGVFDLNGNVGEWTEYRQCVDEDELFCGRAIMGGNFNTPAPTSTNPLSLRTILIPFGPSGVTSAGESVGFRIVRLPPRVQEARPD